MEKSFSLIKCLSSHVSCPCYFSRIYFYLKFCCNFSEKKKNIKKEKIGPTVPQLELGMLPVLLLHRTQETPKSPTLASKPGKTAIGESYHYGEKHPHQIIVRETLATCCRQFLGQ